MIYPIVCCVMLTRDRPEMAARAVRAFRAQTYDPARRVLMCHDTGRSRLVSTRPDSESNEVYEYYPERRDLTIGALRNCAHRWTHSASVIIHWDDDDWSHPNRIAEQVALLHASGKQCVGYNEMLFWDTRDYVARIERKRGYHESRSGKVNEAWLYSHPSPKYCLGTSMCYWRSTWERHPFPETTRYPNGAGEDTAWLATIDSLGISVIPPRMIATIHGGNMSSRIDPGSEQWRRVPEWDSHCRAILEAA